VQPVPEHLPEHRMIVSENNLYRHLYNPGGSQDSLKNRTHKRPLFTLLLDGKQAKSGFKQIKQKEKQQWKE